MQKLHWKELKKVKILNYNFIFFCFIFFLPSLSFSKHALINSINFSDLIVNVAITNNEKKIGLMHKNKILKSNGLLLYYEKPKIVNIWMLNTKIRLDIIFINKEKKIISIHEGKPFSKKIISSVSPVIGVLELPFGCAKKLSLNIDSEIDWELVNKEKKKNIRYYHCLEDL